MPRVGPDALDDDRESVRRPFDHLCEADDPVLVLQYDQLASDIVPCVGGPCRPEEVAQVAVRERHGRRRDVAECSEWRWLEADGVEEAHVHEGDAEG